MDSKTTGGANEKKFSLRRRRNAYTDVLIRPNLSAFSLPMRRDTWTSYFVFMTRHGNYLTSVSGETADAEIEKCS